MKTSSKILAIGIILSASLGSMLFMNTASAAQWKKKTVIKHGHHHVVKTERCKGNRWHKICRVHTKKVAKHNHRRWW